MSGHTGHPVEIRMVVVDRPPRPRPRWSWQDAALRLGWAESGLFALVAIGLVDLEAGVVAAALATSSWLVRRGRRLIGLAGLFAVSSVIVFFMATAAWSNLVHRDGPLTVLIPATLLIGGVGIIGSGALAVARPDGPSRNWLRILAATELLTILVAVALPSAPAPAADGALLLRADNLAFSQSSITVGGDAVSLTLSNDDLFWHTFTIDELGIDVAVPVGGRRSIEFQADPGRYTFYCKIPGHPEAGMVGLLVVEDE